AASGKYTHNYKEVAIVVPEGTPGNVGIMPIVIQKAEQLDFVVSGTFPLVIPWAYPGLTAAKQGDAAARANFRVTEAQVLVQTAQACFAAAGTDEVVGARQNGIAVAQQTLDNAKARFEAGVVNQVEVQRAQVALLRAQQALREAVSSQAQAYRALRTLIQIQ